MTKADLIKMLENIPNETELNFYLIPNDGREEDGDQNDEPLENLSIIWGGGTDLDEPQIDLGIQLPLRRFDDDYTEHNLDNYISRKTDEDITFVRHENLTDVIILTEDNSKIGVAKILKDWEQDEREYIAINHTVLYLDSLTEY